MKNNFQFPQRGETCVGYLFSYGPKSTIPIIDALKDLKTRHQDMYFIWGELDWMDKDKSMKKIKVEKYKIQIEIIKGSNHQIPFHQPDLLVEKVLNFLNQSENIIKG